MTDSLLLIQESVVARDRERSMKSIIESSSQADLMSQANLMKEMSMKEIFTQRNSSQFEMIENIVSSRKQASVRERVVTRRRERRRDRERERGRERDRGRDDRSDISASTEDVSEVIQ
jgi:hypothetical protein